MHSNSTEAAWSCAFVLNWLISRESHFIMFASAFFSPFFNSFILGTRFSSIVCIANSLIYGWKRAPFTITCTNNHFIYSNFCKKYLFFSLQVSSTKRTIWCGCDCKGKNEIHQNVNANAFGNGKKVKRRKNLRYENWTRSHWKTYSAATNINTHTDKHMHTHTHTQQDNQPSAIQLHEILEKQFFHWK